MKVCLMCEGSYPYVTGGVSSWVHMLMTELKHIDFYISAIVVDREHGGKFKYKMPSNLIGIHEIYLQDQDHIKEEKPLKMSETEKEAFRSFVVSGEVDWDTIFNFFHKNDVSANSLLMSHDMLDMIREFYDIKYSRVPFADFLWTYRSMMLPLCLLLKNKLPEADIYHSASTGYAGLLACKAKHLYKKPAIITEHGIYTREREEDVIRSPFFNGIYKDLWIDHFYKLSDCAYKDSDRVISLFEDARILQGDLGCNLSKTRVIPNGVAPDRFDGVKQKQNIDEINLGIIARVAPVKDIKTLLTSFAAAKEKVFNLNLLIMGGTDEDEEYYNECLELTKTLNIRDVFFTGNVDLMEYMGKIDIVILTSISEGQPLSVLEAMSARKPCIVTKVGNCAGLILGEDPEDEPCGIVTPIMSVEHISNAIVELAQDEMKRKKYGEAGRRRIDRKYRKDMLIDTYDKLYHELYQG